MILVKGMLQYTKGDVGRNIFMFTANSTLKKNGALVMGAGNAKAVRDLYVGIDKLFGNYLKQHSVRTYGVKILRFGNQYIGAFQTKRNWVYNTEIELLEYSTRKLAYIANNHPSYTFHLPYPAISNGGLKVADVQPIIDKYELPDNVIVYLNEV